MVPCHEKKNCSDDEMVVPGRTHERFCQYLAMNDSHFVLRDGMRRDKRKKPFIKKRTK